MRVETGGEGSSGVCYVVGPRAGFRLAEGGGEDEQKENKEEQADATSKREEQKKIDGRTENI